MIHVANTAICKMDNDDESFNKQFARVSLEWPVTQSGVVFWPAGI